MVKRDFIRNIILALIAVLILILLRYFVLATFKVHKDATNSYFSNGDVVVVNRNRTPKYKDFIVYKVGKIFYISRVIGEPNQKVRVMDDILYLNDVFKDEPYIEKMKNAYSEKKDGQMPFTSDFSVETLTRNKESRVPKGSYLVLNDNRQNKNDSRKFGLIKEKDIRGVITFKVYPLSEFGFTASE
ncbi:TPA: signal peptidase I [Streptococcus agalactiae]|nr:signal peptidase I [Streptococcus agalactiae]